MPSMIILWWKSLLELIFPPICYFCGSGIHSKEQFDGLCRRCLAQIPFRSPLKNFIPCIEIHDNERRILAKPNFNVMVVCEYEGQIRKAIVAMKFYEAAHMKKPFSSLISYFIKRQKRQFDGIVPVPLHPSRLRERGYNQAALIAECVSLQTGIPVLYNCLVRCKKTQRQSEMSEYSHRIENMNNAFYCNHPEYIAGKNILILDDILTSGETLMSSAHAIREGLQRYHLNNPDTSNFCEITGITLASSRK